jgi:hemoglobin
MNPSFPAASVVERAAEPTEANIRELVYGFYDRVRADPLLGPVFEATLAGRWDDHLPKMCTFWGSLVLGAKQYRGNVQQAHQPLEGVEPQHFSRWLYLFLDTVESRYEPAAAVRFMEPALRIAQSLQLSRFGWDYKIPAEQQALLERVEAASTRRRAARFGSRCRLDAAAWRAVSDADHRKGERRLTRVLEKRAP